MSLKKKIISSVLALGLVTSSMFISNANTQQLEVHHINVGQGDATYIELPDGSDILIDAGKSNYGSTVVNYLNNQEPGMTVDYVIATHPDADHVGGMQEVFKSMNIENFYYPKDAPHDTITWKNVLSLAGNEGCGIKDSTPGTTLSLGGATVKFIQPSKDYSDNNEDSVVTYLDYQNAEFMFNGDIESTTEADMLAQGLVQNIDFMSVPHHGSNSSSTTNFLAKADPEYAVVSVGENSYGHPVPEILQRYTNVGAKVYRTDLNGNVVIKTDGNTATINGSSVDIGGVPTNDWKTHWANKEIQVAMDKGWVVATDTFRPQDSITRAEFVKIFNKAFGLTKTSGKVFNDTAGHWAKNEIDIAITNGVCNGMSATEFRPNDPITREQAAVMIANYKKIADENHDKLNSYKDENQVSSWAQNSVEGVIEKGYMGAGGTAFNPKNNITRAETVVTLGRIN